LDTVTSGQSRAVLASSHKVLVTSSPEINETHETETKKLVRNLGCHLGKMVPEKNSTSLHLVSTKAEYILVFQIQIYKLKVGEWLEFGNCRNKQLPGIAGYQFTASNISQPEPFLIT
jgi:hypothetical protein